MQEFMEIGKSPVNEHGFNMTALALRGSRFHNGVSKIHGRVASELDPVAREVVFNDQRYAYDQLILATGSGSTSTIRAS